MRQVLQSARTGDIEVADVPMPQASPGFVLVQVAASLVSAGTERASSEFAGKTLLGKAAARPDLVREVLGKIQRDGFVATLDSVRNRLDRPSTLGYSCAGRVVAVGEGVTDFRPGDPVACAGAGFAVHAEIVSVPRLLVAKVPESGHVLFEDACFTTVGAVALHGIRIGDVRIGETVGVIGLGLLGQLTLELLNAAGCRVVGFDPNENRAALARSRGAADAVSNPQEYVDCALLHSRGRGIDSVLITAETPSNDPVRLAAEISRDRGTVVAVGTVGMEIERKLYFEKELTFRVSRSYGPGRYDADYEQKGRDYPIGYVRWTENRNMEAFLELLADKKIDVGRLITHRIPINQAQKAYDLISGRTAENFLGVVITYPNSNSSDSKSRPLQAVKQRVAGLPVQRLTVGLLGAGSFATGTLLPAIKRCGRADLGTVCSGTGPSGRHASRKFGFSTSTTNEEDVFANSDLNTVVISTRHNLHARQVLAGISNGKHIFCEKPLCLTETELSDIVCAYMLNETERKVLMVGFNRRFAPMVVRMKEFLSQIPEPLSLNYRINAGYLARDHWAHDPEQGGGRILGEVCHFVDLLGFLAGAPAAKVSAKSLPDAGRYCGDNLTITLEFQNGSQGSIAYIANGDKSFPKERLEIVGGGAVAVLEDFRRLELRRQGRSKVLTSRWSRDKGHVDEWVAFAASILDAGPPPIPFTEIVASTLTTQLAARSVMTGEGLSVSVPEFIDRSLDAGSMFSRR